MDDVAPDGDGSRVNRPSNAWATDTYAQEDPPGTSGAILSVTVYVRARKEQLQGDVMPTVYTYGTEYNGPAQALTTSYSDYSYQWTANPNTAAAWTWTEIINLEAGAALRGQNAIKPAYATQVWVEVEYFN